METSIPFCSRRVWARGQALEAKEQLPGVAGKVVKVNKRVGEAPGISGTFLWGVDTRDSESG